MNSKNIIVHIGYPKTATTTLQNHLFSKHDNILYLPGFKDSFSYNNALLYSREIPFMNQRNKYLSEILHVIDKHGNDETKAIVYSEESCLSYSMLFRTVPYPYLWTADPASIARKIHHLFHSIENYNLKILVTIRKQEDIIPSMYAQAYNLIFKKIEPTKSFQKFYSYAIANKESFVIDALDYCSILEYYSRLFGKNNIKILVFEKLKENPRQFYHELFTFLGIEKQDDIDEILEKKDNFRNTTGGYRTDERTLYEKAIGIKNKVFKNRELGLNNSIPAKLMKKIVFKGKIQQDIRLTGKQKDELKDIFGKGNSNLADTFNLDLKKYGYY